MTAAVDVDILKELEDHARANTVLLSAHIDLTYRCDLGCVHCYLEKRNKNELTTSELVAVLDTLQQLGTLVLLFSGGDIFMRKDALTILRAAAERRFMITIITHAGHITETVARELAKMGGISRVSVSVYSDKAEVHDRVTRVPGSLHRTLTGIVNLREAGIAVEMRGIIMEQNKQAVLEIPVLAAKYDCDYTLFHTIHAARETHIERGRPPLDATFGCPDLRDLNAAPDDRVDVARAIYGDSNPFAGPGRSADEGVCGAGTSAIYVDPEGNVFPCINWEEPAGNVRDGTMARIWADAEVFGRARDLHRKDFEGCTSCHNFSHCVLCPGKAYQETGDYRGVSKTKCGETEAIRAAYEGS